MAGVRSWVVATVLALAAGAAAAGGPPCPRGEIADAASLCVPDPFWVPPPPGYRPVWDDGRHSRNRAKGTEAGRAAMALIWTDTVPMQLIKR